VLSDRCRFCLSVPSVTLVYCGQTAGWIQMKLGTQVGLGPGHIVLDEDPAPLPERGRSSPTVSPYLLWPNGWMDQDATWHGVSSRPRLHCVGREYRSPCGRDTAAPPLFSAHVCCDHGRPSQLLLSSCHPSCSGLPSITVLTYSNACSWLYSASIRCVCTIL